MIANFLQEISFRYSDSIINNNTTVRWFQSIYRPTRRFNDEYNFQIVLFA